MHVVDFLMWQLIFQALAVIKMGELQLRCVKVSGQHEIQDVLNQAFKVTKINTVCQNFMFISFNLYKIPSVEF